MKPVHGLTENHERGLLAGVQYAAKLIRDCEEILAASDHPSPFNRYTGGLTPPQRKITEDYLQRLHQQLLRFLDVAGVSPPAPRISAAHALANAMMFLENALEEMRGRYLRGYGEISAEAERLLDGAVSEMQAQVREIERFLTGASADVLRTRLDSLAPGDPIAEDLKALERIITTHGLVDLRASLTLLVDRALEATFEVAVVGRVSSGKSSLLNSLIGAQLLPTGILPMTSVPTRLRRGSMPAIHVTYAHGRTVSYGIDRLGEFVTEAHNPGNEKRVARVLVDYPSDLLPDGVTFVDTPGLGSVASRGALQTFAYLPRCDHAAFLFDATAPLAEEDLGLLTFLRDAGIATTVLLSKADLLGGEDLQRVQTYVAAEIQKRRLTGDVRSALADAASAAGMVGPPETLGTHREVPLIAVPSLSLPGTPPAWTRVSASLLRRWTADRLQEQWAPALDRAVAAYLDVLKRWAADGLAQLREEFESHSRPLLAQLTPDIALAPGGINTAQIESDLRWLRDATHPRTTRDGVPAPSIQE